MKKWLIMVAVAFLFLACRADAAFFRGVTSRDFPSVYFVKDIGANSVCVFFNWCTVEPEIKEKIVEIDEYINSRDWQGIDKTLGAYEKAGLNVFAIVGSGLNFDLPRYKGGPATPDRLGREEYLNRVSLFVGAFAKRYKDRVKAIFVEDEVNEASAAVWFGWRSSVLWSNYSFIDELIERLANEVRREAPDVLVGLGIHTDIPDAIHKSFLSVFLGERTFAESAKVLGKHVDVLGLSFFPNFYSAEELKGELTERIGKIRALTEKPIVVLSAGYPITNKGENPPPVDWSEEKQARFIDQTIGESLGAADLQGLFYFDADGVGSNPFNYQQKDLDAIEKLGKTFRQGNAEEICKLVLEFGLDNKSNKDNFIAALNGGDGYGLLRMDGLKRSGYYALRGWFGDLESGCLENSEDSENLFIIINPSKAPAHPPIDKNFLGQNYPNPFNPETWIPYQLKENNEVAIRIFSMSGLLIKKLELGYKYAGSYVSQEKAAYWDGKNETGEHISSGIYFYIIQTNDFTAAKKLIILR